MRMGSLDVFIRECPTVQSSYAQFINSLIELEGLDSRTKQLIYIGMKIIADDENAIIMHVKMAKKQGAVRDEIKSTVILAISVIGLKAVSKYLEIALNAYDSE
jgi:alkylhydroperoxidase/carboxymuconolactone decarboxylase family protein YurZ